MKVFLSHKSTQKPMLRELCRSFPSWLHGWVDENELLFGTVLEFSLRNAIDVETDYVVLFLSISALESTWVRKEVEWALKREEELGRVFLLPVTMEGTQKRLHELNMGGKLSIEIMDFSEESTKLLAKKISDNVASWMSYRLKEQNIGERLALDTNNGEDSDYVQKISQINNYLRNVPSTWRGAIDENLLTPYLRASQLSSIGEIPVSAIDYYQSILGEISKAKKGTNVYAVSTLSSEMWNQDDDQADYAEKNYLAAERGVNIKRLFVYDGNDSGLDATIQKQLDTRINIRINRRASISVLALEDIVIFETKNKIRAYICHRAIDYKRRVRNGKIIINSNICHELLRDFNRAWEVSEARSENIRDSLLSIDNKEQISAPGLCMKAHPLSVPVITCEEAATARGIPLSQELKTLILDTSNGLVACHISGDATVWLRAVKEFLEADEAFLANSKKLSDLGLSPGTVSAVLDPVWSLPHLISREIFKHDIVTTNNGTRYGYFEFHPSVLTTAPNYRIGDFEKMKLR